jgi:hypothetical protein
MIIHACISHAQSRRCQTVMEYLKCPHYNELFYHINFDFLVTSHCYIWLLCFQTSCHPQ